MEEETDQQVSGADLPANLDWVPAGTSFTYTLTVTNEGPSDASGITVTDTLPGAVTFVSASAGCSESGGTVTCTAASLATGASVPFTVTVPINIWGGTC